LHLIQIESIIPYPLQLTFIFICAFTIQLRIVNKCDWVWPKEKR